MITIKNADRFAIVACPDAAQWYGLKAVKVSDSRVEMQLSTIDEASSKKSIAKALKKAGLNVDAAMNMLERKTSSLAVEYGKDGKMVDFAINTPEWNKKQKNYCLTTERKLSGFTNSCGFHAFVFEKRGFEDVPKIERIREELDQKYPEMR